MAEWSIGVDLKSDELKGSSSNSLFPFLTHIRNNFYKILSFHYIGYTSLIDYPLEIKLFKTGYYIYMKLKNNCLRTGAYILIDSLIQMELSTFLGIWRSNFTNI